jgi:hypothetical protein
MKIELSNGRCRNCNKEVKPTLVTFSCTCGQFCSIDCSMQYHNKLNVIEKSIGGKYNEK